MASQLVRIIGLAVLVLLFFLIIYSDIRESVVDDADEQVRDPFGIYAQVKPTTSSLWRTRQLQVVDMFKETWTAYERDAFGSDEYHPLTRRGGNLTDSGIGYFIVDALDTMMLMNLTEPYNKSRAWIEQHLDFNVGGSVSTFEVTIRVLGGLLSAYTISLEDQLYLNKAVDLADRLIKGFHPKSGMPPPFSNLRDYRKTFGAYSLSLAEVGTLSLELKYLAYISKERRFWDAAEKIGQTLNKNMPKDGLVTDRVSPDSGTYTGETVQIGGGADSFYEYLLKQYYQTNQTQPEYLTAYRTTTNAMVHKMLYRTAQSSLVYVAEMSWDSPVASFGHLSCFMGAVLSLGVTHGKPLKLKPDWTDTDAHDFWVAQELAKTCMAMYETNPNYLAPESVMLRHSKRVVDVFNLTKVDEADAVPTRTGQNQYFDDVDLVRRQGLPAAKATPTQVEMDLKEIWVRNDGSFGLLRPETLETWFYLWRATGNIQYREWGWKIAQGIIQHAAVPGGGFMSLEDVTTTPPTPKDHVETFFMAETLKYLFLLFGEDSVLPLDQFVFNTEAHPFPIFTPPKEWLQP
jgi:mannosyl-oligosaccharide alpha-1,2-mannosidase